MPTTILQMTPLPDTAVAELARRFRVVRMTDGAAAASLLAREGASVRGIATTGQGLVDERLLERLPALEIIASYSAGLDRIDTAAAARRDIVVTNTSKALAADVADAAMWLILDVARRFSDARAWAREGCWAREPFSLSTSLGGRRVGIVGLGAIGLRIARRASAFDMEVSYFGPRRKPEAPYPHVADLAEMAAGSDVLVLACPANAATRHLVDATVLRALGSEGWLINVARGSVVDEPALIAALGAGGIAGAGLDVCEAEPTPAPALLSDPRVVLLPHVGSATRRARGRMERMMIDALVARLGPS